MVQERIEIITTMVDNVTGASRKINKSIQQVGSGVYKTKEQVTGYDSKGRQLNRTTSTMTRGQHRFRMELLSVMFAGMALYRVTSGLVKAQLELFGVNEMFSAMMTTIFLPIMSQLAPILYDIMTFFMNLPDGVKTAISVFIILGAILGGFLMLFGQIGLGIKGMIMAFPFLAPLVKSVVAVVTGSLGLILIIIAAIVAIVIGMYVSWKENFMGMKQTVTDFWNNFKGVFQALYNFFKGIIDLVTAIFRGDWSAAWEAIKNIFSSAIDFIKNYFMMFLNFCAMIATGVIRIFKFIVDTIFGFFKWLYDKLVGKSIIPDMINAMIFWFWKLPVAIMSALTSILSNVLQWGKDFIQSIVNGISSMASKFKDAFLSIFPSWARDSIWSGGKAVIEIFNKITETVTQVVKKVTGKASGGSVLGGVPYIVGEVGPELFVPNTGGNIVPNNKLGGSEVIINQTNNIYVSDRQEMEKLIRDNNVRLVEEIKRSVAV